MDWFLVMILAPSGFLIGWLLWAELRDQIHLRQYHQMSNIQWCSCGDIPLTDVHPTGYTTDDKMIHGSELCQPAREFI